MFRQQATTGANDTEQVEEPQVQSSRIKQLATGHSGDGEDIPGFNLL